MAEINDIRKNKERSPVFPFITLVAAVERAKVFYAKEKRGAAPFLVAAEHWEYSPSSSGAFQTVSALKSYGLMIDESHGSARQLKLTELALRIILDERPDETERRSYMRKAALTPKVAAIIYDKWNGELPSEASLNHFLVLDLGFSPATAKKASSIIYNNHTFISNVYSSSDDYSSSNDKTDDSSDAFDASSSDAFNNTPVSHYKESPVTTRVIRTERLIDPDGIDIQLQFNGEPTLSSYEFLKDYIELRMKGFERALKAAKDKES